MSSRLTTRKVAPKVKRGVVGRISTKDKVLYIRVPTKLHKALSKVAREEGVSISEMARRYVEASLIRYEA